MKFYSLVCVLLLSVSSMHASEREFQKEAEKFEKLAKDTAFLATVTGVVPLLAQCTPPAVQPFLYGLAGVNGTAYVVSYFKWRQIRNKRYAIEALPPEKRDGKQNAFLRNVTRDKIYSCGKNVMRGEEIGLTSLALAGICAYLQIENF